MYFTFSLKDVLLIALLVVAIIFFIYLIIVLKNLIVTIKRSNEILEDVQTMTDIAEKRAKDIDIVIDGVSVSVKSVTNTLKGNDSIIKQLSTISAAIMAIVGIFKKNKKTDSDIETDYNDENMQEQKNCGHEDMKAEDSKVTIE